MFSNFLNKYMGTLFITPFIKKLNETVYNPFLINKIARAAQARINMHLFMFLFKHLLKLIVQAWDLSYMATLITPFLYKKVVRAALARIKILRFFCMYQKQKHLTK